MNDVATVNKDKLMTDLKVVIADAEEALGFPIEVIAGVEEARLIYIGAAHEVSAIQGNRLVVDIGGGSAILEKKISTEWEDSWHEGSTMLSAMTGVRFPSKKGKSALSFSFGFKRQALTYFQGQKTGVVIGPGPVIDSPNLPRGYQSLSETSYLFHSLIAGAGLMF